MKKTTFASATLAGLLSMSAGAALAAEPEGHEKCYGIAKAGQNDCANSVHECAGMAMEDSSLKEWVFVSKDRCVKIVGGSLTEGGSSCGSGCGSSDG